MFYVYILQSVELHEHYYVGVTGDLRSRLKQHNSGNVSHMSKYAPWTIKTYIAFSDESRAFAFEKFLKSPSARAFAKCAFDQVLVMMPPNLVPLGKPADF